MTVVVITPPEPIVTFEEAKQHVRIDDDGEKAYVEGLIAAAQGWIDGPAGWLGRAIGVQELRWRGEACSPDRLPYGPVLDITEAWSGDEEVDPLDPGIQISRARYWAGYGKRDGLLWVNETPPPIKVAIMMLVAQWYYVREAAGEVHASTATKEMPFAVEALLQPYRVYR